MSHYRLAVMLFALILFAVSACTDSPPTDAVPDGTRVERVEAPGAIAADSVAARQQLVAARQTADVIQQRAAAATANAIATDRARSAAATATEIAFSLALRQAQATEIALAHRATATADAIAFAATIDAQRAQATAQARDTQATADTRALDYARAIAAATADAHALTLAAMKAEASTQIAIERERALSSTVTALCGMSVIMLFIAATAGAYIASQYAHARWHIASTMPVAGGTVVVIGNTVTGFSARLDRERTTRRRATPAASTSAVVIDQPDEIPPMRLIGAEPIVTPLLRPAPESPERRLAVRLLRHSISQYGEGGTRLVTSREPGWNSQAWQDARRALDGYVSTRKGAGGGTYLVAQPYPTLGELLGAVLAGEASLASSPAERVPVN